MKYNPSKIEKKWQKYWESKKLHQTGDTGNRNFMMLAEFPYTSGNLHMGHWFTYSVADMYARYLRMNGYNVMFPIGFDAFGLPAENAAIKHGSTPEKWTKQNIRNMTKQLKTIGATFDWSRVVDTSDPDYYKWTQWIFLKLFEKGLAYRGKTKVNWCPKDKTVLANEQVVDGKCDRCDTPVEQKDLTQWMFKITSFADRLIDDIRDLDWPESTKLAQQNWIGRSDGARIKFTVPGLQFTDGIEVFTTRPDTIFGATFLVVSPELAQKWIDLGWKAGEEVKNYLSQSFKKTELQRQEEAEDKSGVYAGINALNPVNESEIPVWVADYVLGHYGTGAIMAVPAHDERDFEFAKKFNLPIKIVIEPETGKILPDEQTRKSIVAIVEDPKTQKFLALNWGPKLGGTLFIGGGREEGEDEASTAIREIKEETGYTNVEFVAKTELMHHHYFAFSKNVARNIEVVGLHFRLTGNETGDTSLQHDEKGNFDIEWLTKEEVFQKMEDENHLLSFRRLILGEIYSGRGILADSGEFTGMSSDEAKKKIVDKLKKIGAGDFQKTYRLHDWILSRQRYWGAPIPMINCDDCGHVPVSEKELPVKLPKLDDFMPVEGGKSPLARAGKWLKTKCPKCGKDAERETDTMDTFVDSSWYFLRYADPKNQNAFASKEKMSSWLPVPMYIGGREHNTMHLLYARFITKALSSLGFVDFSEPFISRRNHGVIMGPDGKRMSKSRGNVVDPDAEVGEYGADTVRMNFAFLGPFDQDYAWNPKGLNGIGRFLDRTWNFVQRFGDKKLSTVDNGDIIRVLNRAIKEVGDQIKHHKFNTGVSHMMKLLNELESHAAGHKLSKERYEIFLKLLAPFAPHITEELWSRLHSHKSATVQSRIIDSLHESGQILKDYQSIHLESWPEYDESLLAEELTTLIIQINGKMRDSLTVKRGLSEDEAKNIVLGTDKIKKHLDGKEIKRFIYVPDKIANIVV